MSGFVELSDDGDGTLMIWGARHFGEAEVRQHLEMGFRDGWRASAEQLEALARSL